VVVPKWVVLRHTYYHHRPLPHTHTHTTSSYPTPSLPQLFPGAGFPWVGCVHNVSVCAVGVTAVQSSPR
jgi:hypothetical protein